MYGMHCKSHNVCLQFYCKDDNCIANYKVTKLAVGYWFTTSDLMLCCSQVGNFVPKWIRVGIAVCDFI